ncbi:MAG: helix-turn-helix domain-containing protein [Bacteroidota bacterium]|nr:helix-turn-helix domain-containing protein [Bacteroidota bacterium]
MFEQLERYKVNQNTFSDRTVLIHPRLAWIIYYKEVHSVTKVCERFGISRKTFYKWWNKYTKSGGDSSSLLDSSKKPHNSPLSTPEDIVKKVVEGKILTGYGQRRLREYLKENYDITLSEHTIWKLLKRHYNNDIPNPEKPLSLNIELFDNPGKQIEIGMIDVSEYTAKIPSVLFTALDLFTHLRISKIYNKISAANIKDFVSFIIDKYPFKISSISIVNDPSLTGLQDMTSNSFSDLEITSFAFPNIDDMKNGIVQEVHQKDIRDFFSRVNFDSNQDFLTKFNNYLKQFNNHQSRDDLDGLTPLQKLRTSSKSKFIFYFEY